MNCAVKTLEPVHTPQRRRRSTTDLSKQISRLIGGWIQRRRQRRQLMTLPPEMLKDIGISRADAVREGSKPFWR